MNEYPDLKAKIDEEPLNAGRSDADVLAWLNETETGPWLDVPALDFSDWCARWKLPGRLFAVRNEAYTDPRADDGVGDDERSAAHMLHAAWNSRLGLETSKSDVRSHLADAAGSGKVISVAASGDLLGIARPDVERWRNADWTIQPGLGDVTNARALP